MYTQQWAQFGKLVQADADALKAIGSGDNVPGNVFTVDGGAPASAALRRSHSPCRRRGSVPAVRHPRRREAGGIRNLTAPFAELRARTLGTALA
jgi:hypothetical protein